MSNLRSGSRLVTHVVIGCLMFGALAAILWRASVTAGQDLARAHIARVESLWPHSDFLHWPERERAVVAALALACRLEHVPAKPEPVAACLRGAAVQPGTKLPRDVSPDDAKWMLEELLRRSVLPTLALRPPSADAA